MSEAIEINVSAELQSVAAAMEALGNETRLSVCTLLVPAARSGLTVGGHSGKIGNSCFALFTPHLSFNSCRFDRAGASGLQINLPCKLQACGRCIVVFDPYFCVGDTTLPARRQKESENQARSLA